MEPRYITPRMTERRGLLRYDVGMLTVALLWGANFSVNKFAIGVMPPLVFSALRFLAASALLIGVVALLRPSRPIPAPERTKLILLGIVGNTGYQAAFMSGLKLTSAINASLILAAVPIQVAVLGSILGVERPTSRMWWGILIGTVGVGLVIAARGVHFSSTTLRGDLLVLFGGVCWAAFTVGLHQVAKGLDPLRVTTLTTMAGTPGLVIAAWPEARALDWAGIGPLAWLAVGYSVVFAIVIAYVIWSYAVQAIGGNRTALYNCVTPVFAILIAWLLLGERPVAVQGVGAALVLGGVLISQGTRPA